MKKTMIIPAVLAASMLFGCASSDNMDTTAMEDDMSMSETQTMAGTTEDTETMVVEETAVAVVPLGTVSSTTLQMENTQEVDEMFENMGDTESMNVLDLVKSSPNLSTLATLIEQADLVNDLQRVEQYTLFAPTNAAFAKIPQDQLQKLLMPENKAMLMKILQAHVLPSEVSTLQLESNSRIRMSEDTYIPIETGVAGTNVTVGGAQILKGNIEASNGTIHVIDSVIIPGKDTVKDSPTGY